MGVLEESAAALPDGAMITDLAVRATSRDDRADAINPGRWP